MITIRRCNTKTTDTYNCRLKTNTGVYRPWNYINGGSSSIEFVNHRSLKKKKKKKIVMISPAPVSKLQHACLELELQITITLCC